MRLHIIAIITTYLYPNKSGLVFSLGLTWVICQICNDGTHFAWGPLILVQIYIDLYNFINVDKVNMINSHVILLQVWEYEHILVVRPVGL